MNFSYQRTALQAVGWYLTFFLIGLFVGSSIAAILVSFGVVAPPVPMPLEGVLLVVRFLFFTAYPIVLAFALVRSRLSWLNIVLAVLAPLLSAFAGVLLSTDAGFLSGLIPLAVLTTRPRQKSPAEIGEVFE
jgi:hypothetical protein